MNDEDKVVRSARIGKAIAQTLITLSSDQTLVWKETCSSVVFAADVEQFYLHVVRSGFACTILFKDKKGDIILAVCEPQSFTRRLFEIARDSALNAKGVPIFVEEFCALHHLSLQKLVEFYNAPPNLFLLPGCESEVAEQVLGWLNSLSVTDVFDITRRNT